MFFSSFIVSIFDITNYLPFSNTHKNKTFFQSKVHQDCQKDICIVIYFNKAVQKILITGG